MNASPPRRAPAGFTLVELVAAMLTAAILALTAGSMLFYAFAGWQRNTENLEMQRDGTIAMDMLARAVRAAAGSNVLVQAESLQVAGGGATLRFSVSGNDLVYDPDTATPGDETAIVAGRLASFSPTLVTNVGVAVDLALQAGENRTALHALLGFRN
jgi:Tfp pilus assembly protein PilW